MPVTLALLSPPPRPHPTHRPPSPQTMQPATVSTAEQGGKPGASQESDRVASLGGPVNFGLSVWW